MASPTIEPAFPAEPSSQNLQTDNDSGANNGKRKIVNTALNQQVQCTATSQQSSDRDSPERKNNHSGLNDDRILLLSSSQESGHPPLTHQSAAWQSKYILTLGMQSRFGSSKIQANKLRQMAEVFEAILLYS
jgi:hypothetical protein